MHPTQITLIAVSSNNKVAYYSTEDEPFRVSDIRRDEATGLLYFGHGKQNITLPRNFQPKGCIFNSLNRQK